MNALEFALVAAAGGAGAGARYALAGAVMRGRDDAFPVGILIVNTVGSFLLGALTGLGAVIGPEWVVILGVGLLGGFTTFSTVSVESVVLAQRGRRDWAWTNLLGTLVAAVAAAGLGLVLGGILGGAVGGAGGA